MCAIFFFLTCYVVLGIANAASMYDQSQTGNLNVQIDLKDLQVIALTKSGKEEYVDYDYAYDYSEMTIKPQNGTTPKPLNVTTSAGDDSRDNSTITTTVNPETTSESIKNSTTKPPDAVTVPDNGSTTTTTVKSVYKNTKHTTRKSDVIPLAAAYNSNNCTRGFVLCDSQKPLSILELLSQRFKRRDHRKESEEKQ